ncbi:MAG: hypothetical protein AAF800_07590 [Planctomycetota bacterium]
MTKNDGMMGRTAGGVLLMCLMLGVAPAPAERGPGQRSADVADGRSDERPLDRGPRDRRWTDAEAEAAREVIGVLYPELAERLNKLRDEDPRAYRDALERRFPRVRFLVRLRERDPEMYALRVEDITRARQVEALGKAYRAAEADGDDMKSRAIKDDLEDAAAAHFDVRQTIRRIEIDRLRARLEAMEQQLEEQDDDRDDLIERRVDELTGG